MLISSQYKFLFIHVAKAAGSSIYSSLEPFANPRDKGLVNKVLSKSGIRRDYQRRYFAQHAYITEALKFIPQAEFEGLYKFGFVRNPYDWLVSMYSFLQQNNNHRHNQKIQQMSFPEYVDYEIKRNLRHQHLFLCNQQGQIMVDYIGRFETLASDFKHVMATIGLNISLPHINASKRNNYRDYYDDKTLAKVTNHWCRDIELFQYSFD